MPEKIDMIYDLTLTQVGQLSDLDKKMGAVEQHLREINGRCEKHGFEILQAKKRVAALEIFKSQFDGATKIVAFFLGSGFLLSVIAILMSMG